MLPIHSWALNVALVYNEDSRYQSLFMNELSTQVLANNNVNLTKMPTASFSISALKNKRFDVIVNLDNKAGETLISSNSNKKTLHALTTLMRARSFSPCLPRCSKSLPKHRFFVLDQLPARQLQLIQLISPNFKHIGIIATNKSAVQLKVLVNAAKRQKLTINEHITDTDNMRYAIGNMSKSTDIILAIADTDIYNSSSLPQILLTSYRYQTPIIGFTKGFVKAGAIAGVVSNMQQLAQHLIEVLTGSDTPNVKESGNIIYPKYYDVISNRSVAKSLNLHFPSDNALKKQLISYETVR
jgi:hypothetical protein